MSMHQVIAAITEQRVVAIVRAREAAAAAETARRLLGAGLRAVEVSLVTPDALRVIEELAGDTPAGAYLGAGTVLNAQQARECADAGAAFLVAPTLRADVIEMGHDRGLAVLPGACTPTEMMAALDAGADLVKLFPATQWSTASVRDLRASLPTLPLVPTGGVTPETAAGWLQAGCVAVGMGSALTAGRPEELASRVTGLLTRLLTPGTPR
jgi:2-dehydro-3-deoxyphosphogluconate aldolase / (4S)-4-hydroxy-2-oxoglutarate aldolase